MSRYNILITEITQERKRIGSKWEKGAGEDGAYGHTPEIETVVDIVREIFMQDVGSLDLKSVIMSVNGMHPVSEQEYSELIESYCDLETKHKQLQIDHTDLRARYGDDA